MIGVCLGLVVAILPGFGGTVGLALTLPFIYGMDPLSGVAILCGTDVGGGHGGHVSRRPAGHSRLGQRAGHGGGRLSDGQAGQGRRARSAPPSPPSLMGGLFGAFVLTLALQVAKPMILAFGTGELLLLGRAGRDHGGRPLGAQHLSLVDGRRPRSAGGHHRQRAPRRGPTDSTSTSSTSCAAVVPLVVVVLALFAVPELIELLQRQGHHRAAPEPRGRVAGRMCATPGSTSGW